jgi:hypothetical protein
MLVWSSRLVDIALKKQESVQIYHERLDDGVGHKTLYILSKRKTQTRFNELL